MRFFTQRFESFRKNGIKGWAGSQPVPVRALLLLPCVLEYLIFKFVCVLGLAVIVFLMAVSAIFGLDRQPEVRIR